MGNNDEPCALRTIASLWSAAHVSSVISFDFPPPNFFDPPPLTPPPPTHTHLGRSWHAAALRENRNKAYEDFIAVGEDLVRRGVTTPPQLACRGGSNGGLLMGNMLTLRPDLFGAVVCAVPLLDMKRYSHLLAGASWMAEYGDPDKAEDWTFLRKYSAYHNLDPEATYPPLLMTTSTRDDRVHPYHARSFVKRLQDIHEGPTLGSAVGEAKKPQELYYYENMEGGHGGAADAKQQAFMTTLYLEFLRKTIGKGSPMEK